MPSTEKLDTHRKALTLNLDTSKFGSFAEIGAGQEFARWFLGTNGRVPAEQLHCRPPLAHLYTHLVASNFLVPLRIPG